MTNIRGRGLFIAFDLPDGKTRGDVLACWLKKHNVMALTSGERAIRLRPPLTLTKDEAALGVQRLRAALTEFSAEDPSPVVPRRGQGAFLRMVEDLVPSAPPVRSRSWRAAAFPLHLLRNLSLLLVLLFVFVFIPLPQIILLRWRDPSTTAFIRARQERLRAEGKSDAIDRRPVPLAQVSPALAAAVVAAEDARFYEHHGIDWTAVAEARAYNVQHAKDRRPRVRGASTITQQLAKNLWLSGRRTWGRKVREAAIALALDACVPKKRILEVYLSAIEWGERTYGCEAAARALFAVPASRLTAAQAAKMAAMIPSPRWYRAHAAAWERRAAIIAARAGRGGVPPEDDAERRRPGRPRPRARIAPMKSRHVVALRGAAAALVAALALGCGSKPAEIRLTPAKLTFYGAGHTQTIKYDVVDKKGRSLPGIAVAWTSDKPKVASVDANGLVRSLAPGRAMLTVTAQAVSGSASVEVIDVASLVVSPSRMTLVGPPGTKMGLLAEVKDSKGNLVNQRPKWISGDAKIAAVDANGVVTSVAEGRTTIIASLGNDQSSASDVRVLHREIATFEISPLTLILKVGETQRINATVKDATGLAVEDAALVVDELGPEDGRRVERGGDGARARNRRHLRRDVREDAVGHGDRELRLR